MLEFTLNKLVYFFPLSANVVFLFFLILTKFHKVPIYNKLSDLLYYWSFRPFFVFLFAFSINFLFHYLRLKPAWSLNLFPTFFQIIFCYLSFDLFAYLFHAACHNSSFLFVLHKSHHTIDADHLSWENGAKDSLGFELILMCFLVILGFVFGLNLFVISTTIILWKLMLALTHHSKQIDYGILNFILVCSKKHREHHLPLKLQTPGLNYGVTISLWDHFFEFVSPLLLRLKNVLTKKLN